VPNGTWFTNTVEVTTPPEDVNPADNTDSLSSGTGPDLMVDKWLAGGSPLPGEMLTYTLHFAHNAQQWGTSGDVWLTDTLPAGTEFVGAVQRLCGDSYFCDRGPDWQDGSMIAWNYGRWWPGEWNDLLVTVRLTDTAEGGTLLTNTVKIATNDPANDVEPNVNDNTDSVVSTVIGPRFTVGKTYAGNRVAGTDVTYTLQVTNTGNTVGTGVVLTDVVPSRVTYGGGGAQAGGTVSWTLPTVAATGGSATAWFTGTLGCTAGQSILNQHYRVAASDQGPTSAEGAAVAFTTVTPTIEATIVSSPAVVRLEDTVYFTATATTNGTALTYAWAFGDGITDTGRTTSHSYAANGVYTVVLTVTDSCGFQAVQTKPLIISHLVYVPLVIKE
jgi:uncharacterized repeat protein (TIGR01451 family)